MYIVLAILSLALLLMRLRQNALVRDNEGLMTRERISHAA